MKLEKALKRSFPGQSVESLAEILSFAAEKEGIDYEEIEMQEDMKVDTLLVLQKERLLLPLQTSKTLAWEDGMLTFKPGERYEMPHVIRHLIRNAEKTGEWNPDCAIRKYLEEIEETEAEKIIAFFKRVKEDAKWNKVTPKLLEDASENLNLKSEVGKVIAELKGGGVISPCLRNPLRFQYEINPSLTKQNKIHNSR